jgi:radical SAM-linked protein
MLSDPPPLATRPSPNPGREPVRTKVRIRFQKGGDLRLVSHQDLVTCFERMLRRADLPFHSSQGFHPKPRLVFPLSLALGIVGNEEVAELELDAEVPANEIHARLARQAPPGLEIHSVQNIDRRTCGQVTGVTYRLPLPAARPADLPERINRVLEASECWVERTRPRPRRLNLRPYVRGLRVRADALEMDLEVTPAGTARPEEIADLLGLGDVLAEGPVVERTRLELLDECRHPTERRGQNGDATPTIQESRPRFDPHAQDGQKGIA